MGMPDPSSNSLRVAILSRSIRERDCLREILEMNGLQVVSSEILEQNYPNSLDGEIADVLLVNLDESDDTELDNFIEQTDLPILFNDSASIRKQVTPGGRAWGRRLATKLMALADNDVGAEPVEEAVARDVGAVLASVPVTTDIPDDEYEVDFGADLEFDVFGSASDIAEEAVALQKADTEISIDEEVVPYKDMPTAEIIALNRTGVTEVTPDRARRVWVLGASIGGPQAVKEFLSALPEELPVGFILAQHIGAGFVNLLADQLSRVTRLKVSTPKDGMVLEKGQIVVAPVEERICFNARGTIALEAIKQRSIYSPSIDDVMTQAVEHYGADVNAIIFSGMGNDGTLGAQQIARQGGLVWAQEAKTCIISSMADSVRSAGIVSFSGTPQELAANLTQYLEGETS